MSIDHESNVKEGESRAKFHARRTHGGKGHQQRPTEMDKFRSGWDRIYSEPQKDTGDTGGT